jgi:hypothetical protein
MREVWRPGVGYLPHDYEKRSGLDSSFTTDLATGDKMTQFSSGSILLSEEKTVNK